MPSTDNSRSYVNVYATIGDEPTMKVGSTVDPDGLPWVNVNIAGTMTVHISQESALELVEALRKTLATMDQRVNDGFYVLQAAESAVRNARRS